MKNMKHAFAIATLVMLSATLKNLCAENNQSEAPKIAQQQSSSISSTPASYLSLAEKEEIEEGHKKDAAALQTLIENFKNAQKTPIAKPQELSESANECEKLTYAHKLAQIKATEYQLEAAKWQLRSNVAQDEQMQAFLKRGIATRKDCLSNPEKYKERLIITKEGCSMTIERGFSKLEIEKGIEEYSLELPHIERRIQIGRAALGEPETPAPSVSSTCSSSQSSN